MSQLLTDEELDALTLSAINYGKEGATQEQIEAVIRWANDARTDASALRLVLKGELLIGVQDGEISFRKP